jgi:hypothetical protein
LLVGWEALDSVMVVQKERLASVVTIPSISALKRTRTKKWKCHDALYAITRYQAAFCRSTPGHGTVGAVALLGRFDFLLRIRDT